MWNAQKTPNKTIQHRNPTTIKECTECEYRWHRHSASTVCYTHTHTPFMQCALLEVARTQSGPRTKSSNRSTTCNRGRHRRPLPSATTIQCEPPSAHKQKCRSVRARRRRQSCPRYATNRKHFDTVVVRLVDRHSVRWQLCRL